MLPLIIVAFCVCSYMVSLSLMGVRLCLPSKCDGYFPAKFSSMYRCLYSSDMDQNFLRKSDFGTVPSV